MAVVVQNRYFPRTGRTADALTVRRQASAVRHASGRPVGRILILDGAAHGEPAFIWECDYDSLAARDDDAAWAAASAEFEAVRQLMSPLLERFERQIYRVDDESETGAAAL